MYLTIGCRNKKKTIVLLRQIITMLNTTSDYSLFDLQLGLARQCHRDPLIL